jgi:hypothetical protein
MVVLLWDASALTKRYAPETGSDTVNALFRHVPLAQMVTTVLSYVETVAVLVRKRNQGLLDDPSFIASTSALKLEVIHSMDFGVLGLAYDAILDGAHLVHRHNLNASDAAILTTYLRYARAAGAAGDTGLLVASDHRMLRAAGAEGLAQVNPEVLPAADVSVFLAGL